MTAAEQMYEQIVTKHPDQLNTYCVLLNLYAGFGESIVERRSQIAQVVGTAINAERLERDTQWYQRVMGGIEPLPWTEQKVLIQLLSTEARRRFEAFQQTDDYKKEQERLKDFLD